MLAWICERTAGRGEAITTAIGNVPAPGALDADGLGVADEAMTELLRVDADEWRHEAPLIREFYARFGDHLPEELADQLDALERRLG